MRGRLLSALFRVLRFATPCCLLLRHGFFHGFFSTLLSDGFFQSLITRRPTPERSTGVGRLVMRRCFGQEMPGSSFLVPGIKKSRSKFAPGSDFS